MAGKRKYGSMSTRGAKRRRTSAPFRKRRSTRKRSFRKSRGGGRKPFANRTYKRGNQGKSITKHIYIPGTLRRSPLAKNIMKQIGDEHHSRIVHEFSSSILTGSNPCSLMIGMPLIEYMKRWGNYTSSTYWGNNTYATFPTFDKILLKHIRIRIVIKQVQENCKYAIRLARMKRSTYPAAANARSNWPNSTAQIDDMSPARDWKILWEHRGIFDDPINNAITDPTILRKERQIDLYLPFDRVITNRKMQTPTSESDWVDGTTDADYTFLHFDTDDATTGDGEYLNFRVLLEYVWNEND